MCIILTTRADTPYPGIRQILCRRDMLDEGEESMAPPESNDYFAAAPENARYFLMLFMQARQWSLACDILAAHPVLLAPWASDILREVVMEGHLSAEDFDIFCAHIFVLDLAQSLGIEKTRAFLTHLT
jgi:hypothetical protein